MKMPKYCALCRQKEMELFDSIINEANYKHEVACREAKCRHAPSYELGSDVDDVEEFTITMIDRIESRWNTSFDSKMKDSDSDELYKFLKELLLKVYRRK